MSSNLHPFGYELVVDLYGCSLEKCFDAGGAYTFILDLIKHLDMESAAPPIVYKIDVDSEWPDKAGITAFGFLITSSIVIHTLPNGYVALNVFSCKEFSPENCRQFIINYFQATSHDWKFYERGSRYQEKD